MIEAKLIFAFFLNSPNPKFQIVVLVERKKQERVTIASTASEYPLAIFGFREPSP